jgi:hypothetical protein
VRYGRLGFQNGLIMLLGSILSRCGGMYFYINFMVLVSSVYSLHMASVLKTILVLGSKWLLVVIHTVSHAGKVCLALYSPLLLLTQIKFGHKAEYMAFLLFWVIEYIISASFLYPS